MKMRTMEISLEDLLTMLSGPAPSGPQEPLDHFLAYDDQGEGKVMYHRIRTRPEQVKADGTLGAPSTLTYIIGEATPLTKSEAEMAEKMIKKQGPCSCDDPNCYGRFTKVRAMKMPEGWVATEPIITPPGAVVQ